MIVNFVYNLKTFIFNSLYWIKNFKDLNDTLEKRKILKLQIGNSSDIIRYMKNFTWVADRKDYMSWPITVIHKDLKGDCDDAASIGKWLLDKINIDSDFVIICNTRDKKDNHMICVAKHRTIMISNESVSFIRPEIWENEILNWSWHYKHYDKIKYIFKF